MTEEEFAVIVARLDADCREVLFQLMLLLCSQTGNGVPRLEENEKP